MKLRTLLENIINTLPLLATKQEIGLSSTDLTITAGEDISANTPVYIDNNLVYSCKALIEDLDRCMGISRISANTGSSIIIATEGELSNINWTFQESPVYIGNSILTQSITTQEYTQQVAVALNATTILINIQQSIEV